MERTLSLVLTHAWFDLMVTGEKSVEYRDVGGRYHRQLMRRDYQWVKFYRGYAGDPVRRWFTCRLVGWEVVDGLDESFPNGLSVRGRKVAIRLGAPCERFPLP